MCVRFWVTRPERPKVAKDEVKQARRAQSQPEGPPARSRGPEGPYTSIVSKLSRPASIWESVNNVFAESVREGGTITCFTWQRLTMSKRQRLKLWWQMWAFSIHGTTRISRFKCFFTRLLFGKPDVTWYFHFPLQYFSITTFYISQFSRRSRIRSAPQQNPHFQIKERKNMKYCTPCHLLIFSSTQFFRLNYINFDQTVQI